MKRLFPLMAILLYVSNQSMADDLTWYLNPANQHEYAIVFNTTWEEAEKLAVSLNGHLVTVNDYQENAWIAQYLAAHTGMDCWIGYTDESQEGVWVWVSGESSTFTGWGYNQPSGGTQENYAKIYPDGTWHDDNPKYINAILERDPNAPTPDLITRIPFDGGDFQSNRLSVAAPNGYRLGAVSFGSIPESMNSDNKGVTVHLLPGMGVLGVQLDPVQSHDLIKITGRIRSSNNLASVSIIALNYPIDSQLSYVTLQSEAVPVSLYKDIQLLYKPPEGEFLLGFQVVNSPFSSFSCTVWIDEFRVETLPEKYTVPIELSTRGNFDEGLGNLVMNFNDGDGNILPFFETVKDVAVRLSIQPQQTAANIGISAKQIPFPGAFLVKGNIDVQRDAASDGGVIAFILSNGFQEYGLFRSVLDVPTREDHAMETLSVGGSFYKTNNDFPLYSFIQVGGPNAESSVVVDDLQVVGY